MFAIMFLSTRRSKIKVIHPDKVIHPERWWRVPSTPASPGPGPDEDSGLYEDEPLGPDEEYDDPEHPAMPWDLDVAAIWAETGAIAAEDAADTEDVARRGLLGGLAAGEAGARGRRGPGQPGSAGRTPGASASPAGGFGAGQPLDVAPGGAGLLGFAERVAGDERRLGGATDDEVDRADLRPGPG